MVTRNYVFISKTHLESDRGMLGQHGGHLAKLCRLLFCFSVLQALGSPGDSHNQTEIRACTFCKTSSEYQTAGLGQSHWLSKLCFLKHRLQQPRAGCSCPICPAHGYQSPLLKWGFSLCCSLAQELLWLVGTNPNWICIQISLSISFLHSKMPCVSCPITQSRFQASPALWCLWAFLMNFLLLRIRQYTIQIYMTLKPNQGQSHPA